MSQTRGGRLPAWDDFSEFVLFPDGSIETRNPSVYVVPIHEQNNQSTFSALYGRAIFDFSGKVFPRHILADRLNGSIYPILPEVVIQDIRLQVFEWGIKNNISIESVTISPVAEYFKEKSFYRAKVALIINGRNHWYYFNDDRIE